MDQRSNSFTKLKDLARSNEGVEKDSRNELMWGLMGSYLSPDIHTIQRSIVNHIEYTLASTRFNFDQEKAYRATAHSVRDRLIESWNDTNQYFDSQDVKRVNYLSLEFLMGRFLQNNLANMDLETNYKEAVKEMGFAMEDLFLTEKDPALGNGGLGRLAACFLDSMASLDYPAWGYGIRYTYGMFQQEIRDGFQIERPDYWLTQGNPWEIERSDVRYPIRFYGSVTSVASDDDTNRAKWEGGEVVQAVACDNPVPGYDTFNTINLRLWRAAPSSEFNLTLFNEGNYLQAVDSRQRAESITYVLYPNDSTANGKELRLKQQYFFVSATIQDIIRRFLKKDREWEDFPEKNAIQLNDTHPSIGIPELMRVLVDEYGLNWDRAWNITTQTFAYTNHTILPEALEKWSASLLGHLLPRHLEIIYEINWRFLQTVEAQWPGDAERLRKMSIIQEGGDKMIRMANLSIVGSHAVNGVAELHSELVKHSVFPEFYEMWPEKFQNKTNGVTPRRWVNSANPGLSDLITRKLLTGDWTKNLGLLAGLRDFADDAATQEEWMAVKRANKCRLAATIKSVLGIEVNPDALFDIQVKRIHEYKRQLMNCLYCIHRYLQLKQMTPEERATQVPRVTLFGGKAAPAYHMAKNIIKLIGDVGEVVNNDPEIGDLYKVVFLPNYNVSNAEIIIPASDISQHISTAGMEASGTSNMKFAMNGGLIIGTMDGANVEMAAEMGEENMFIFGARLEEIPALRHEVQFGAPKPLGPELAVVYDQLKGGVFGSPERAKVLLDTLKRGNDYYLLTHDFKDYCRAQREVDTCFKDKARWARMSILSTAGMGKFSSDRTIHQYAEEIWGVQPTPRPNPADGGAAPKRSRSFANFDPNAYAGEAAEDAAAGLEINL